MIEQEFLKISANDLLQFSSRIEDCLGRLNYDQIWTRNSKNENAVGNLVLHLCGNMRQWIVSGVGEKPDVRDRDSEFAASGGIQPAELAALLKSTIAEAVEIIGNLPPAQLLDKKTIQKHYDVTVMEAIYHVVEHFAQHTAQIIFATKLMTGQDLGYYRYLNPPAHKEAES